MAIPNYGNFGLSAVFLGIDASYDQSEEISKMLLKLPTVKGLWRACGGYQMVATLVCEKECEGAAITDLHKALADSDAK